MGEQIMVWCAVITCAVLVIRAIFRQAQALLAAPLIAQIATLSESIKRFSESVDALRQEIINLRERIAKVESSASQAHKRIDTLEDRVNHYE